MSFSVKVVGNTNKLNASKIINPTLKLVQTVLTGIQVHRPYPVNIGEWHISFNRRIRSKADKKWMAIKVDENSVRVRTKPGDNSTAWEILIHPPKEWPSDLQGTYALFNKIHPQKLTLVEPTPTPTTPATKVVPLRSRQETQARASSVASFKALLTPHARSIFDEIKVTTLGGFYDQYSLSQVQEHRGVQVAEEFCKLFKDYGIPLDDSWTTQNAELPFTLLLADCPYDENDRRALFNALVAMATECDNHKRAPRTAIANGVASSLFGVTTPDTKKKTGSLLLRMIDEGWLSSYQIENVGAGLSILPAGVDMIESLNLPDDIQTEMFAAVEESEFVEEAAIEKPAAPAAVVEANLDELAPLSKRMDELRLQQPAYDEEINTLQTRITDNNIMAKGVEVEIKRLEVEVERLRTKITDAVDSSSELQTELDSYTAMKDEEATEIADIVKKIRAIVSP